MLTESYVFLFGGLWNLGAGGPGAPGAPGWAYFKTRIVITCGEQAFPTSYFKKVHESCSLCLSPPQRPPCVVGRLVRKKKRVRGGRWEGGREKRGLFPPPSWSLCGGERACATQARKLERKRKKLEDWRGKGEGKGGDFSLFPNFIPLFCSSPNFLDLLPMSSLAKRRQHNKAVRESFKAEWISKRCNIRKWNEMQNKVVRKICYVKSIFQILYAVEQFNSPFSR